MPVGGHTDYRCLPEYGFQHKWINHDLYYCDPDVKSLNTKRIEKGGDNTTTKNDINPLFRKLCSFSVINRRGGGIPQFC